MSSVMTRKSDVYARKGNNDMHFVFTIVRILLLGIANRIRGGLFRLPGDVPARMVWGGAYGWACWTWGLHWQTAIVLAVTSFLACSAGLGGGLSMGRGAYTLKHDWIAMTRFSMWRVAPAFIIFLCVSELPLAQWGPHYGIIFAQHIRWYMMLGMVPCGALAYFLGRYWPVSIPWLGIYANGVDAPFGELLWGIFAALFAFLSLKGV